MKPVFLFTVGVSATLAVSCKSTNNLSSQVAGDETTVAATVQYDASLSSIDGQMICNFTVTAQPGELFSLAVIEVSPCEINNTTVLADKTGLTALLSMQPTSQADQNGLLLRSDDEFEIGQFAPKRPITPAPLVSARSPSPVNYSEGSSLSYADSQRGGVTTRGSFAVKGRYLDDGRQFSWEIVPRGFDGLSAADRPGAVSGVLSMQTRTYIDLARDIPSDLVLPNGSLSRQRIVLKLHRKSQAGS